MSSISGRYTLPPEQAVALTDISDRVRFATEPAAAYSGTGYDLVTMFDCLHDIGDPVGAARHVRSQTPLHIVFEARP